MKFLVIFALALASASAFDLRNAEIKPVIEGQGRITNGQNAAIGQFPYQVGLSIQRSSTYSKWCGACLIGKEWVLTAAHCTDGALSLTVYLGATVRTSPEVTHNVPKSNIILHPGWSRSTGRNDISLVKIPAVSYTAKIQPVKLPSISSSYPLYVGEKVIATGWGDTDFGNDPNHLQWAVMQVITNAVCTEYFGQSIAPTNICISTTGGISTCEGDSGGPLVQESSKILVGLTSFGTSIGCTREYPAVFTRVTSYLDWIKTNTGIAY